MSLNDSLSEVERAKLAVWDYPVSDKYTKIWQAMQEAKLPNTLEEAVDRVLESKSSSEGFAYVGKTNTRCTSSHSLEVIQIERL
jgi:ionotropic glutamate receptor